MALHIQLVSDLGVILDLDASPYGVNPTGGSLGSVDMGSQYTNVWQRGWRPLVSQNYGNREIELSIQLRGTSHDDLHSNYRQVAQVLAEAATYHIAGGKQGAAAYLCVQLAGATSTTTYDIIMGEVPVAPVFSHSVQSTTAPYMLSVPIKLILKPWGHTQALTRATATGIALGGGKSSSVNPNEQLLRIAPSSAMTRTSPARVTLQNTSAAFAWASGLWLAARNAAPVIYGQYLQAEFGTTDAGYTVTSAAVALTTAHTSATAAAQGGARLVIDSAPGGSTQRGVIAYWTLGPQKLSALYGKQRVYSVWTNPSTRLSSMQICFTTLPNATEGLASQTNIGAGDIEYLGIVDIPYGIQEFKFGIRAAITSGASFSGAGLDALMLIPNDEQVFHASASSNFPASGSVVIDALDNQFSAAIYDATGGAAQSLTVNNQPGYGFQVDPRGTVFTAMAGQLATRQVNLTVDYYTMTDWLL